MKFKIRVIIEEDSFTNFQKDWNNKLYPFATLTLWKPKRGQKKGVKVLTIEEEPK